MSLFYEKDHSWSYGGWLQIHEHLGYSEPDCDEVWAVIRKSKKPPHIGNIMMELVLSRIKQWCDANHIECLFYVNALDSHLIINKSSINDLDDFLR